MCFRERGYDSHDQASRRAGEGPSQRQLRVAEEVRHALAAVFARADFRDPELAGEQITVTEVRASPDLKHVTAFVSGLGRADLPEAQLPALHRAAPWLRAQVANAVRLRVAPDLHFQPDTALDYAMQIDRLLHQPEVGARPGEAAVSATQDEMHERKLQDARDQLADVVRRAREEGHAGDPARRQARSRGTVGRDL